MDIPIEDEFFTALTHLEEAADEAAGSEDVKELNHWAGQEASRPFDLAGNYFHHRWHPNYLQPLYVAPKPKNRAVSVTLTIVRSLYRASLCLVLILLFACFTLLACPVRFVFYALRHCTQIPFFNPTFRRTHCDPLWPFFKPSDIHLPRSEPSSPRSNINFSFYLLSLILEGREDLKELQYILQHRVRGRTTSQSLNNSSSVRLQPPWLTFADQAKCGGQTSDDDFEQTLNTLLLNCQPHASASRAYLSQCRSNMACLNIMIQSTWSDRGFCPLKLLSKIVDNPSKGTVAIEPKLVVILPCPFGNCWTRAIKLICSMHDILSGPASLLGATLERRKPVWNDAIKLKSVRQAKPKRTAESWRIAFTKVANMDHLLKACRLLRCNVQELLLSLLGGTLRRYFREMGICCPPPITSTLLVDNKHKSVENSTCECGGTLVPLKLPVDVDGVIPRVWEAQERLCRSLESAFPEASWLFANAISALLPTPIAQRIVGALYGASDGIITFLKVHRNLRLCKRNIRALLVFPIPDVTPQSNLKFACTFTVHSWDVYISLSVSVMHFHKPNLLADYMEEEVDLLFRQIDPRLLNLNQPMTWPLGFQHPMMRSKESLRQSQQLVSQDDESILSRSNPESDIAGSLPTIAELENLLVEIRFELQELKRTVFPDRESYVSRLTYMQSKMEAFQDKLMNAKRARKLYNVSDEAARRLEALVNSCQPDSPTTLSEDGQFVPLVRSVRKKSKRRRSPTAMEQCFNVQIL